MPDYSKLCHQFSHILGGEMNIKNGVCMVSRERSYINLNIFGRPSHSKVANWSFETLDSHGKALNLGETPLLQEEVYPFTWHLQRNGIILSALHNHWLLDNPHLLYAHYISIEEPLSFARKVSEAYKLLK
ncbi:DUF1259 domain-containing protein [Pseudoneobacillus sp. C159]